MKKEAMAQRIANAMKERGEAMGITDTQLMVALMALRKNELDAMMYAYNVW